MKKILFKLFLKNVKNDEYGVFQRNGCSCFILLTQVNISIFDFISFLKNDIFQQVRSNFKYLQKNSFFRFSIMFYTNSWGRIFGKKIEEKCTQPGNLASSDQLINISRQNNSTRFRPEFSTTQILTGTIISQGRKLGHKILIFLFWLIINIKGTVKEK